MVAAKWYGNAFVHAFNKRIDFDTDTVKVALLANTYTPDQDVHQYFSDVSANEVTGTGYTAGGNVLTTATMTYTGATNVLTFSGDNAAWAASSITAAYAVLYVDTGTAATSPLICYVDFQTDVTSSSGTFQITWDAAGIAQITVS